MKLVIFTHPEFINSQSMPRYANMLINGMRVRGHEVEVWTAKQFCSKIGFRSKFKKWLGYIDQFVIFPLWVKIKLIGCSSNTLFVFADHALGPWMSLVSKRPFIVHCHDFLAQRSSLGEIPENKVKASGRLYQKLIRNGFKKSANFISISERTRQDLHYFLNSEPEISEVVYNGLNQNFKPENKLSVRIKLSRKFKVELKEGYLLHVGGNQFYKNRKGVIFIYNAWRDLSSHVLPLLLIGAPPNQELLKIKNRSLYGQDIIFMTNISDADLKMFYQGTSLFLFPSLAEGFGWPIAEAMASGSLVLTTNEAPMNEVGGSCSYYLPKMPNNKKDITAWVKNAAYSVENIIQMSMDQKNRKIRDGVEYVKKFDPEKTLERIESIYSKVHQKFTK
jgi:glycosyltransferase involved in cell wall biosynthesis